ncbi:ATP-binding protein, partial [Colwellia sp. BRX8-8]|nr:ATP-binding protein [Colwellia sp. BRX8-8]
FVGRENELSELTKAHATFIAFHQESKDRKKTSQWTLIKGEPGTGKTALINKHLANIDEKSDARNHSQIKLRLLNQVGHSSEVTGLASLIQSIQSEAERLTQYYQANQNFIQEKISEKNLAYKNAKTEVKHLEDNRKGLFKLVKGATEFVADVASLATLYQAGTSALNTFTLGKNHRQTGEALHQENSKDKKQEQFNQLNMALRYLSNIAQIVDKKAEQMPLLLFVDDLQWIDELTAEFILAHLLPAFPTELLFTARGSDSETSYKLAVEEQGHSPYKLALFDVAKLSHIKVTSERKPKKLVANQLITLQPQIIIKGMDHETLSELIKLTYQNASKDQTDSIASAVMNALSVESITETTQVITLFAIETLNLISDPSFYRKNTRLTPLIIQPKKGVYEINALEKQVLINTVENIFTLLRDAHTQAYTHDSLQDNSNNHFTLSSYAVMEERLFIIGQYFNEYSNAAIFSLQLSALIGTPFESTLVQKMITKIIGVDLNEYPLLEPLKLELSQQTGTALEPEHYDILEEILEILKRLDLTKNMHQFKHGLFSNFLRQKLKYEFHTLFSAHTPKEAMNMFFDFCSRLLIVEIEIIEREKNSVASMFFQNWNKERDIELRYYRSALLNVIEMAYEIDASKWTYQYRLCLMSNAEDSAKSKGIDFSIKLYEKSLYISEECHKSEEGNEASKLLLIKSLNELATMYKSVNRRNDAIKIDERILSIIKPLYGKNKILWVERYIVALGQLAISYISQNKYEGALTLQKQAITYVEEFYNKFHYKTKWMRIYSRCLNQAVEIYLHQPSGSENSIELCTRSLSISKSLYEKWKDTESTVDYAKVLSTKALLLSNQDNDIEAIECQKRSVMLFKELYQNDNEMLADLYTNGLNKLAGLLNISLKYTDSVYVQKISLDIIEPLFENDNTRYSYAYSNGLNNLATSFINLQEYDEAKILREKNQVILKALYEQDKIFWVERYIDNMYGLVSIYDKEGDHSNAVQLIKTMKVILEPLFEKNNEMWAEEYIEVLMMLVHGYNNVGKEREATYLQEQSIILLKQLYEQDNARWLRK